MKNISFNLIILLLSALIGTVSPVMGDLRPECNKKGKWGYVDDHGQIVIKYQYTGASEFKNGVAHVLDGKKYGVIDQQGKYVIKPDYDIISPFNEYGLAQVTKGNKSGFIDMTGKIVIPVKYAFVGDFNSDGVVWVNEDGKVKKGESKVSGGEFTLFRKDGSNFLDDSYKSIGFFIPFTQTFSKAQKDRMTMTERRLTEGADLVAWKRITYAFVPGSKIYIPNSGLWASYNEDGYFNGVYEKDGKELIPSGKYYVAQYPHEGMSIVLTSNRAYNCLDVTTGVLSFDEPVEGLWGFKDGHALGKYRGLWYVYDKKGKQCSEGYTDIYPANGGVHVVRNGTDKYGLIDYAGNIILPTSNYSVYPFIGGASLVKTSSKAKAGYIGADGKWIIPPTFDNGISFENGRALVSLDGKWGCVDQQAKVLIPFEFNTIMQKGDKSGLHYWVKRDKDSKYELYDISKGSTVLGTDYAEVTPFDEYCTGLAKVNRTKVKDTWGVIDLQGKVIIPFEYTSELAAKAAREYESTGRGEWTEYRNLMFRLRNDSHPVDLDATVAEDKWDF